MKRVAFCTLGCKVNQYETDAMSGLFEKAGYEIVSFDETAEIYVVNTCTVTQIADKKSRQMLHRARRKNADALVAAVGCYVEEASDTLTKDGMVDLAVGNNKKSQIVALCEAALAEKKMMRGHGTSSETDTAAHPVTVLMETDDGGSVYEPLSIEKRFDHTRAHIKIQDGCDQFCSYCIIPYARGRVRSRRPEEALREVRRLTDAGCREIVLTGIHISSYGLDFDHHVYNQNPENEHLIQLIESLAEIMPARSRIRLGSLEPRIVTETFAGRLAAIPQVCPQFHLSMQSGCDATLSRMNRHYTTDDYRRSCDALRSSFEDPAITTDVIVGFPGETGQEFETSLEFCRSIGFARMHVFKYSVRPGTRAAGFPDKVSGQVKNSRSDQMSQLEIQMRREYEQRQAGCVRGVIPEIRRRINGRMYITGHTDNYIPVAVEAAQENADTMTVGTDPISRILPVRLTGNYVSEYMIGIPEDADRENLQLFV